MYVCYISGIFDVIGLLFLMVYDEFDFIDEGGCDEVFCEM